MPNLSRRDALSAVVAVPAAACLAGRSRAVAQAVPPAFPGMIVRMRQPLNLEFPFSELKALETPQEQFYVRNHFAVPKLDANAFRLSIEGHVEQPLKLSLADLAALGESTLGNTLECAGNGRIFLIPQVRGLQWGHGAVGNARWTGTPLAAVLERAKVKPGAMEVILVGEDVGAVAGDNPSPGPIPFDRSIPMEKAMKPETILAHSMNGEKLTPNHGAPLRAIVGGWYGMASIKWLRRIIVTDRPYQGFWQTMDYADYERSNGLPSLTPITAMLPKAVIARPTLGDVLPVDREITIFGAAWAGENAVDFVEFSSDEGKSWSNVKFTGRSKPFEWRFWTTTWTPTVRGPAKLLVKATDTKGRTQSMERDPDRRTYRINHLVPVDVLVK